MELLCDSAAAAFSFARRTGVNSAPAYMLANVVSTATPNPLTFTVHLNEPVSAFMDYLAAPYGPEDGKPHRGQSARGRCDEDRLQRATGPSSGSRPTTPGPGPTRSPQFVPGSHYVLTAYPAYWGTKPYYTTVNISIVPDITVQQAELQSGQLSMILHGLPVNAVDSFKGNKNYTVQEFPAQLKAMLYVNPTIGVLKSQDVSVGLAAGHQ